MQRAQRQSGIEIARIIAMLMILIGHYTIHSGFEFVETPSKWISGGGVNRLLLASLNYGGFGVAIFVIISGYCGINSTFKWKKIIQLIAQVVFYSIIIYLICLATGFVKFSFVGLIKNLFPIIFEQYWFATVYIILYLFSPYINKLLKSLTKSQFQKLLFIMLVLWCVIPTLTTRNMYGREVPRFIMFYAIGAYIKMYPEWLEKGKRAKIGLIISFVGLFLSSVSLQLLGTVSTTFSSHYAFFYNADSILTLLGATCLVFLCARMNLGSNAFINLIASATFGVFLIHAHAEIRYNIWNGLFKSAMFETSIWLIPHLIASVLTVYILCTIIELLRKKFIERPFMILVDNVMNKFKKDVEN